MDLPTYGDVHGYNTRHKNMIRLPIVKSNWGKQRLLNHEVNEWNNLNDDIRSTTSTSIFKRRIRKFFYVAFKF